MKGKNKSRMDIKHALFPTNSSDESSPIIEKSLHPAAILDHEGVYLRYNQHFAQLLEKLSEHRTGLRLADLWQTTCLEQKLKPAWDLCLEGGAQFAVDCTLKSPSIRNSFHIALLPDPTLAGKSQRIIQILHANPKDDLHFQTIETQLRRYRSIIDLAPALISIKDYQGVICLANRMFEVLDGPTPEEYVDRTVFELFPIEIAQALWANDLAVFQNGQVVEAEEQVRHKDGTLHTYLTYKFPLKESNGVTTEVCAISIDITARKFYEKQAIDEKMKAEEASRVKSDFLANMSHEIRTPLTVIRGYAEIIAKKSPDHKGQLAHWISSIVRSSQQLEMIINDILNLAKVEAGKIDIELCPVDLMQLVNDLKDNFAIKALEKNIYLRFQIKSSVPTSIETDPHRLTQILANLIGNAIKFTENGGVDVILEVNSSPSHQQAMIFSIQDTGIGMSAEQREKLFQPFSQADGSITRRFGGTGLGLVLSKRLAQLLGGDVFIQSSTPQTGTVIVAHIDPGTLKNCTWITEIPAENIAGIEEVIVSPQELLLRDLRILIVEDAPDIQALLHHILHQQGAQVEVANHGQEALSLLKSQSYDLIVMDNQMPVMDGIQATKILRAEGYDGPIIAITAHALQGEREKCLQAGFDEYLTKPLDVSQVISSIQRLSNKGSRFRVKNN